MLPLLTDADSFVSEISMIEVLGFHKLNAIDKTYYEIFFNNISIIPIDRTIVLKAIELRQSKRMSLGDAIIASTALIYNLELHTNNDVDFMWISQLRVIKPMP
jgi:toxin FitB